MLKKILKSFLSKTNYIKTFNKEIEKLKTYTRNRDELIIKQEKIISELLFDKVKLSFKYNGKIRVAFFVIYDSVFPAETIYETMIKDLNFDPLIIVIPDIARGEENMFYQLNKTYNSLSKKYDCVIQSYDQTTKNFVDYSNYYDLVCTANPYDSMTHEYYRIKTSLNKKLFFFINYGYPSINYAKKHVFNIPELSKIWKYYIESENLLHEYKSSMLNGGENLIVAGYPKMDSLYDIIPVKRYRKRIIIAPHHTVRDDFTLHISNFIRFSNFFLKLPCMYPEIDFVFRPHPLLKSQLENSDIWGIEKTEKYFNDISKLQNVEYQEGGEYLQTFVDSDGIIHDCSSFLAEYLYTEKPCCYILTDEAQINSVFMKNGIEMLEHYYLAYSEKNIIDFIENVIINSYDEKKYDREKFIKNILRYNYPSVSEFILNDLRKTFI